MVTENERVYLSEVEQRYVERLIMSDEVLTAGQWKLGVAYLTTAPFTNSPEEWDTIARQDAQDEAGRNEQFRTECATVADEIAQRGPFWAAVADMLRRLP